MITVVIGEDHKALIDGINSFLQYENDIQIIANVYNGLELVKVVNLKQPKVVLCDIRMPVMDGIEATKKIKEQYPSTKVIAFTMFDQSEAVRKMLEAGADGYLLKNSGLDCLVDSIRTVYRGERYYDKKLNLDYESSNLTKSVLSSREIEILELIGKGLTSHQIADALFIGKSTVDTHRKNMVRKLGLTGSGELLRYAVEKKYLF